MTVPKIKRESDSGSLSIQRCITAEHRANLLRVHRVVFGELNVFHACAHSPLLMYFEKNQLFNRPSPQDIENFSPFSAPALIKA